MTEQPKNFWQLIWNPQGKVKRKLTMLWWCGWVLWTAGWFATFTGKHTEDTIINFVSILFFLPLPVLQLIEMRRDHKQFRSYMNDMHIKLIVLETMLEGEEHRYELAKKKNNELRQQLGVPLKDWDLILKKATGESNGSE